MVPPFIQSYYTKTTPWVQLKDLFKEMVLDFVPILRDFARTILILFKQNPEPVRQRQTRLRLHSKKYCSSDPPQAGSRELMLAKRIFFEQRPPEADGVEKIKAFTSLKQYL